MSEDYKQGLVDGKIEAIEDMIHVHKTDLDFHKAETKTEIKALKLQQEHIRKIAYMMLGALVALQALPLLKTIIEILSKQ